MRPRQKSRFHHCHKFRLSCAINRLNRHALQDRRVKAGQRTAFAETSNSPERMSFSILFWRAARSLARSLRTCAATPLCCGEAIRSPLDTMQPRGLLLPVTATTPNSRILRVGSRLKPTSEKISHINSRILEHPQTGNDFADLRYFAPRYDRCETPRVTRTE
jgi:hypothetical protein